MENYLADEMALTPDSEPLLNSRGTPQLKGEASRGDGTLCQARLQTQGWEPATSPRPSNLSLNIKPGVSKGLPYPEARKGEGAKHPGEDIPRGPTSNQSQG